MMQFTIRKGGERFIFRCNPGDEQALIDAALQLGSDGRTVCAGFVTRTSTPFARNSLRSSRRIRFRHGWSRLPRRCQPLPRTAPVPPP